MVLNALPGGSCLGACPAAQLARPVETLALVDRPARQLALRVAGSVAPRCAGAPVAVQREPSLSPVPSSASRASHTRPAMPRDPQRCCALCRGNLAAALVARAGPANVGAPPVAASWARRALPLLAAPLAL